MGAIRWMGLGAGAIGLGLYTLRRRRRIELAGRSVLITGGSRGLGLLLARELAARGARLTLLARDPAELERARAELAATGARVQTVVGDVRDAADTARAVAQAVSAYGALDVLVNNAGIIQAGPLDVMTQADFEQALATHFWGPLYLTRSALPEFQRQGRGRIVNIASIGGVVAVPHLLPYSASKFALVGLSDGLRAELAHHNVLVTTVIPGLMRTGSHVNAQFKGQHRKEFAWFALSDALPFTSMDGRRAAQHIVAACEAGAPVLVLTWQARAAILAQALVPGLTAELTRLAARLLPGPPADGNTRTYSGWESRSPLAPSPLTALADRATAENNELPEA